MKILIADDSNEVRERLTEMFLEYPEVDFVYEAADAMDAKVKFKVTKPDLVVLDIQMPKGNGMDVLESIRQHDKGKTPVIMLTNFPYPQYQKRCHDLGADYFFDKSHDIEKVLDIFSEIKKKFEFSQH